MAGPQQLIALRTAFYGGSRVRQGQRFTFHGDKIPSWAAPVGDVEVRATGTPVRKVADTKPKDAQEAVKRKTGGVNDTPLA